MMAFMNKFCLRVLCLGLCVFVLTIKMVEFGSSANTLAYSTMYDNAARRTGEMDASGITPCQNCSKVYVRPLSYKKIVIIIAYMRTGSSLAGATLQEHPGTLYVFEPLRAISKRFYCTPDNETTQIVYPNGRVRTYARDEEKKVMINEIKSWVTCKFENLSLLTFADEFNLHSKIMSQIQLHALYNLQLYNRSNARQRHPNHFYVPVNQIPSLQRTKNNCKVAPLIVLKLIRLTLAEIKHLIPLFPNLKIIHLNRDPRGIFNSRWNLRVNENRVTNCEVEPHCQRWAQNLNSAENLSRLYKNQIMTVRYEKMAEDPHGTFRNICRFIDIPYSKEIKDYVTEMTSANRDGCSFCNQRKNSTETAWKWRHELNFTMAKLIYDSCKIGNEKLEYLPLDSEDDLRDLDLPFYVN